MEHASVPGGASSANGPRAVGSGSNAGSSSQFDQHGDDINYSGLKIQGGVAAMPSWNVGELPEAPRFQWSRWFAFLGPGLVMGGSAIGGGEWLTGPIVTARYGGSLLWLATVSILCQVIYNIEISRYTLYTGEPIFTGKFRTLPGPTFWLITYFILDFGTAFPYLAASCATPVAAIYLGHIPNPTAVPAEADLLRGLGVAIFLLCMVPLVFGGKIYDALKGVMTFKIFTVMGFLLFLAFGYSTWNTWWEILTGFLQFGNVPVNEVVDLGDGKQRAATVNLFVNLFNGKPLPVLDLSMMGFLSTLVAISGQGGLSNTPISNYTRDQGWGMGRHVGAIPSLVGGHNIQLSHEGTVFLPTAPGAMERWKLWVRHVARDQWLLWFPACFFGLALPSMLSIQFLGIGTPLDANNKWVAAGMTAGAVQKTVGGSLGQFCWLMTLFCGFLVLAPTAASTIDGYVRRWVDAIWTSSKMMRKLDPSMIRYVYFGVLCIYAVFGLFVLWKVKEPALLMNIASNFYNIAFGFSCWHVVYINTRLLPKPLRPGWGVCIFLSLAGIFFWCIAGISAIKIYRDLMGVV